jgi:subtilisin-like proprotein convertase family protein
LKYWSVDLQETYSVTTAVGCSMNPPHNPLTFADIDPAQINVSDGAYPAAAGPHISTSANQVHNEGEVWCEMLFEVRARLITRLGFAAGSQRMLQLVTDGMKLTPINPNFIQARDAILAADQAGFGGADVDDIWAGFATRGAGFGATDDGTNVTESFRLPNVEVTDPFSVSDAPGDNDGYPEPGEHVILNVTVGNHTGRPFTNVVASVPGGGSANYGTLANGASVTKPIPFTIPQVSPCDFNYTVTISTTSTEIPAPADWFRTFHLGAPVGGGPIVFANPNPIAISQTVANPPFPSTPYGTSINVSGLAGTKTLRVGFKNVAHSFTGDIDMLLVGPGGQRMTIMSDVGGSTDTVNLDFSLSDSATSLLPATGPLVDDAEYRPSDNSPADAFPTPAPAAPYQLPAPAGSATLTSVFGNSGANFNGTWTLYVVDDAGSDTGVIEGGWYLSFGPNEFICSVGSRARADFDGDGTSDISVLRNGSIWYLLQSRDGFTGIQFGAQGDKAVPGDYDGDGRTDEAVFRAGTTWYLLRSTAGFTGVAFGAPGDLPVAADYDGDHKTDIAVYRPSTGVWYVIRSSDGAVATYFWGQAGDKPLRGDFDGDGKSDPTVFRGGNWFTLKSTSGTSATHWGQQGDKPVPADYDGDHITDLAVYRAGVWYILASNTGTVIAQSWGLDNDVAVPADYDGDGREDIAVFRSGVWYILGSVAGRTAQPEAVKVIQFGAAGDDPAPAGYIPEQ